MSLRYKCDMHWLYLRRPYHYRKSWLSLWLADNVAIVAGKWGINECSFGLLLLYDISHCVTSVLLSCFLSALHNVSVGDWYGCVKESYSDHRHHVNVMDTARLSRKSSNSALCVLCDRYVHDVECSEIMHSSKTETCAVHVVKERSIKMVLRRTIRAAMPGCNTVLYCHVLLVCEGTAFNVGPMRCP